MLIDLSKAIIVLGAVLGSSDGGVDIDAFTQEVCAQIDVSQPNNSEITVDGGLGVGTTFSLEAADKVYFPQEDGSLPSPTSFTALSNINPIFTGLVNILRDSAGAVVVIQGVAPPATRRTHVPIGELFVRESDGVITIVKNQANQFFQDGNIQLDDLAFRGSAVDASLKVTAPGDESTTFNLQQGSALAINIGDNVSRPHTKAFAPQTPVIFVPFLQNGVIEQAIYSGLASVVDPTVWDDGSGSLVSIGGSGRTTQIFRIFLRAIDNQILILHGQELFTDLKQARDLLQLTTFNIPSELFVGTVDLGGFMTEQSSTDFRDQSVTVFFTAAALGGSGGGGVVSDVLASEVFFSDFVPGPPAPVDPGDSVEVALEKHEARVLLHQQTVYETGQFKSVIRNSPGGMYVTTTGSLIYKGPPKKITAISAKLTNPDTDGGDPATFQFTVGGNSVTEVTAISSTDTEENFVLSAADQPIEDGDLVDVITVQGGDGDALGFDGYISLADQ